jgi:hypothetical protein
MNERIGMAPHIPSGARQYGSNSKLSSKDRKTLTLFPHRWEHAFQRFVACALPVARITSVPQAAAFMGGRGFYPLDILTRRPAGSKPLTLRARGGTNTTQATVARPGAVHIAPEWRRGTA